MVPAAFWFVFGRSKRTPDLRKCLSINYKNGLCFLFKDFIKKLNETVAAVQTLENEQESLKARLKEKTVAFDANMAELGKQLSEAKKEIKLEMPQETWKEFGIEDKK